MAIIFTQTDNAVTFEVGCSVRSAGATTGGRALIEGGVAGVTDVSVDPSNNTEAAVFALATTGGLGEDTWEAGDYVVRLNISGSNGTSQWTETYICERTAGGAFNTVASLTGQTTDVSGPGIVSHTVNRATDFTPVGTDSDLYIVVVFSNSDQHGNSTTSILPDQNVDTPITAAAANVTGSAAQTLQPGNQSASGGQRLDGAAAQTLSGVNQSALGDVTIYGSASQTLAVLNQSASGDVVDYDMPWSNWLPSGDTISASTWTADDGITIDSNSFTDTIATVWVSGGTDGVLYKLVNQIVTAQGRTKEDSLWILVQEV